MISVVLIGPMGSGKSTVATELAARLDGTTVDTDTVVEQVAGKPVSEIFIDDGEPAFRQLEREAVRAVLAEHANTPVRQVVSLGGGAVLDPATQTDLETARATGTIVVFLEMDVQTASRRVGLGQGRPLLTVNPRASWIRLSQQRRPIYSALATLTIDTSELTPSQIAEQILEQL